MTGFNLEKFKEIITSEIDELYDQYEKERTEKNNEGKYNKKTKEFKVSEIPKEKLKKTLKYYHDHVFKTIQGNYFVQLTEDKNKVSPMSAKTFNEVFGQTIKEFHPNLLKQDTIRYEVDIYDDNFTVDRKNKRINLAMSFNYTFTESPLIEEEKEQLNYLLDEFVFKVICNSNQNVYEFLLDMIGCYTTTKDSIKDNLSKRKITNEMIEARKPHEDDFEEVFCNNDYDPVERRDVHKDSLYSFLFLFVVCQYVLVQQ